MSNFTDFVGGINNYNGPDRGNKESSFISVNGVNSAAIPTVGSHYNDAFINEKIHGEILSYYSNDLPSTQVIQNMYRTSSIIEIASDTRPSQRSDSLDFLGLMCDELIISSGVNLGIWNNASYDGGGGDVASNGNGFMGISGYAKGTSGTNKLLNNWDYIPKGGDGGYGRDTNVYNGSLYYGGGSGGVGFSGGGGDDEGNNDYSGYPGGGFVLIITNKISGTGTVRASAYGNGGGGMISLNVKEWSGLIGLDVTSGKVHGATDGSYAICRIESNGDLTLMVHSENGTGPTALNGQIPIFGDDASIHFDSTTPLTPSAVTQGTPISIAVGGTDSVDSTATHGTSNSTYLTYASDDTNIATVDSNGLVTGIGSGSCTITATSVIDGTKSNTTAVTVS